MMHPGNQLIHCSNNNNGYSYGDFKKCTQDLLFLMQWRLSTSFQKIWCVCGFLTFIFELWECTKLYKKGLVSEPYDFNDWEENLNSILGYLGQILSIFMKVKANSFTVLLIHVSLRNTIWLFNLEGFFPPNSHTQHPSSKGISSCLYYFKVILYH